MKNFVLIFSIICGVSSSQNVTTCIYRYSQCAVPLINNYGRSINCSLAENFMSCVTKVTEDCLPVSLPDVQKYRKLTEDVCTTNADKIKEWKKAGECAASNIQTFENCGKNLPKGGCNATYDFLTCYTSKMKELCGEFAGGIAETVTLPLQLLASDCQDIETKNLSGKCVLDNMKDLLSCQLEGEFNKIGDICSSVKGFTECFVKKIGELCGEDASNDAHTFTDGITFSMDMCQSLDFINEIPISECQKGVLKCNVQILNVNEIKCEDMSKHVGCMADAAKTCEGNKKPDPLYVLVLQKYKAKYPDYCNENSAFNKNIKEKAFCINNSSDVIVGTCYKKLAKDKEGVSKNDKVGNLRTYVNSINCLKGEFGKVCGKDAESAVNDLFSPLEQSMDDSCRQLTGKRCNGTNALAAGTWLLIAAMTFLLTRKNE